ncbi:MAG: hypothetical protein OHK0036_05930 [Bacteroidia bacterium]
MNINHTNIHQYIQKLSLGLLTESEKEYLFQFLEQYPEYLESEIEAFDNLNFSEYLNNIYFDDKDNLYKPDEIKLIAYIENQLGKKDKEIIEHQILSDKLLQKELNLFQLTKLQPDLNIIYPHKENLKKVTLFILKIKRAAAVLLILLSSLLIFLWLNHSTSNYSNMAEKLSPEKPSSTLKYSQFSNNIKSTHKPPNQNISLPSNKKNKITHPIKSTQNPIDSSNIAIINDNIRPDTNHFSKENNSIVLTNSKDTIPSVLGNNISSHIINKITSINDIPTDVSLNNDSLENNTNTFRKLFQIFKRQKIKLNHNVNLEIQHQDQSIVSFHIPKIEIINQDEL